MSYECIYKKDCNVHVMHPDHWLCRSRFYDWCHQYKYREEKENKKEQPKGKLEIKLE